MCVVIWWWVWGLSALGFFLLLACFVLATVKYTFSLHSMTKLQDKNCFVGLINVEDRERVCEKEGRLEKLLDCTMSDFTTR